MGEKAMIDSRAAGFHSRWSGLSAEKLCFRPQMDTLPSFLAGKGPKEVNHLWMNVGERKEYWHRHEPGYMNGDVRILKIGAHPDDTGLDSGAAYLAVHHGKVDGIKKTRFGVITATAGQKGEGRYEPDAPIEKIRINEDVEGTGLLGADFLVNLGYMDGDVPKDEKELEVSISRYFSVLRPHVVILADPEDPAHKDHKAVSLAALMALRNTNQNPIVIYNEYQNGNKELTPDHVAYRLTYDEYRAVWDAFFVHWTQTRRMTDDIEELIDRPFRNADLLGFDIPIGVFRQDPKFSNEPFGKYLGDRVVPISQAERELQLLRERIYQIASERISRDPTVIFDAEHDNRTPQDSLQFGLALTNSHLVAPPVLESIKRLDHPYNVIITEIDPEQATNPAFFEANRIPMHAVAKTLVVRPNGSQNYAACIVPGDTDADLNGLVAEQLGVRQVSLAPQIIVEQATGMEIGSLSPFGLPEGWPILVDQRLVQQIQIIVGSGNRASKLVVPGTTLGLQNVRIVEGLGV